MLEQNLELDNPFSSVFAEKAEVEELFKNNNSTEQNVSYNDLLSSIVSINKDYQKLNEAYEDVKKMANSYIEKENDSEPKLRLSSII